MTTRVFIVEDEKKLAQLLQDYLESSAMQASIVSDGAKVIPALTQAAASQTIPDVILLDIMLPNIDGLSLCKEIRQTPQLAHIPIIMTTARVDEIDRLLGLEIGADDYVCKPYSPREVVARVKAICRRLQKIDTPPLQDLSLDHDKMQAQLKGCDLGLTAVEYSLLRLMADSPAKIFSRTQLMDNMYQDYRVVSERTIDSHIKKLRQKIALVDKHYELVHSVYGVGYKVDFPPN